MKILFICGSLNQTTMMHRISRELQDHECYFTPYYADGLLKWLAKFGLLNNTILGGRHRSDTMNYLRAQKLPLDLCGKQNHYDLVLDRQRLHYPEKHPYVPFNADPGRNH